MHNKFSCKFKKVLVVFLFVPLLLIQVPSASLAANGETKSGQEGEYKIENEVILEKDIPEKQTWWSQNWYWVVGGIVLAAGGAAAAAGGGGGGMVEIAGMIINLK